MLGVFILHFICLVNNKGSEYFLFLHHLIPIVITYHSWLFNFANFWWFKITKFWRFKVTYYICMIWTDSQDLLSLASRTVTVGSRRRRPKKRSALRAEISQIVSNQTNKKDKYFTSLFNEHEICRRPTDRREVIYRITRIVLSKVASDWTNLTNILFQSKILQFVLFAPPLGGWWFNYSVHSVNYLPSVSGSSTNLVFVFMGWKTSVEKDLKDFE